MFTPGKLRFGTLLSETRGEDEENDWMSDQSSPVSNLGVCCISRNATVVVVYLESHPVPVQWVTGGLGLCQKSPSFFACSSFFMVYGMQHIYNTYNTYITPTTHIQYLQTKNKKGTYSPNGKQKLTTQSPGRLICVHSGDLGKICCMVGSGQPSPVSSLGVCYTFQKCGSYDSLPRKLSSSCAGTHEVWWLPECHLFKK